MIPPNYSKTHALSFKKVRASLFIFCYLRIALICAFTILLSASSRSCGAEMRSCWVNLNPSKFFKSDLISGVRRPLAVTRKSLPIIGLHFCKYQSGLSNCPWSRSGNRLRLLSNTGQIETGSIVSVLNRTPKLP